MGRAATDARAAPNDLIAGTTPTPYSYGHDQETVGTPRPKSGGLVGGEAGISSTLTRLSPQIGAPRNGPANVLPTPQVQAWGKRTSSEWNPGERRLGTAKGASPGVRPKANDREEAGKARGLGL
ncbi:hypothetical protein M440DRAFT_1052792 [Trichoderma longibrachiatum ATCC 18648]|uniref:Uncharacterized protein n=1 Tax=Trichoderma longibrachiatum ATCC 18648 TaxID=983965 RepID=A0A2T4BWY5_TRILO|nr:hypothetical protein M440DRAFT_1052792 [Trichoderma longibrachiatum ATCC 18648]